MIVKYKQERKVIAMNKKNNNSILNHLTYTSCIFLSPFLNLCNPHPHFKKKFQYKILKSRISTLHMHTTEELFLLCLLIPLWIFHICLIPQICNLWGCYRNSLTFDLKSILKLVNHSCHRQLLIGGNSSIVLLFELGPFPLLLPPPPPPFVLVVLLVVFVWVLL